MECNICLDSIEKNLKKLKCGHCFHKSCINQWLEKKNDCPYCRKRVLVHYNDRQLEEQWYKSKQTEFEEFLEEYFEMIEMVIEHDPFFFIEDILFEIQSYQKTYKKIIKMCGRFETDYEVSDDTICYFDKRLYKLEKDDVTDRRIDRRNDHWKVGITF